MKRNALWLVALALAMGLIAAGCGDDDDDEGGDAGEALTKQEFITQADQICTEGDNEVAAQEDEFFGGKKQQPTPDQVEDFATTVVVPGIQKQIDGIAELTPPQADQAQVDEFLDTAQGALDQIEDDPSLLAEQEQGADPFAETRQLGTDLGLTVCAQ